MGVMPRIWSAILLSALIPCNGQWFDTAKVTDLRLDLPAGQWEILQRDYLLDTYYEAKFTCEGAGLEKIAIRSRGNGSRYGKKPGLKLDFNKYKKGQTFRGFKTLVLDNHAQDPSFLSENLSLQLFGKMGLPAPRTAYVHLYVNGLSQGLYSAVEPIDKIFLQRAFGEDGGYLYDYEWGTEFWFHYPGPAAELYFPVPFQPETKQDEPDPGPLVEMVRLINEAPDEELGAALAPYLDLRKVLDYLAVEVYLAERDGLAGEWGINNFYFYRREGTRRYEFIPWDRDNAFGEIERPVWQNVERNVLLRRVLERVEYRDHFFRALDRVAGLAGGEGGWLAREVDAQTALIREFVLADSCKPYANAEYEEAVEQRRAFAAERAKFLLEHMNP